MKVRYDDLLTYDLLYDLYINKKLSSRKIAAKLGINKTAILNRLRKFNLTREMQLNTYKLNDAQKDFVIGSALGDGAFHFEGKNYRMSFCHAENQKKYLGYKLDILSDFTNYSEPKQSDGNYTSFENGQMMHYFHTRALPAFNEFAVKSITENLFLLNENSFAIWMMDDGSLRNKKPGVYTPTYSLAIQRFTEEETNTLVAVLFEKFSIKCSIARDSNNKKYNQSFLYFPTSETHKISNIIKNSAFGEKLKSVMAYKIV